MSNGDLQYRADGTVWCRWPRGDFVEVIPKSRLDYLHAVIFKARREMLERWTIKHARLRAALELIATMPIPGGGMAVDAYMKGIAHKALEQDDEQR